MQNRKRQLMSFVPMMKPNKKCPPLPIDMSAHIRGNYCKALNHLWEFKAALSNNNNIIGRKWVD